MVQLSGGIQFDGDPDERIWVSPETVFDSIPLELERERSLFDRIVGRSMPAQFLKRSEVFGFALNAWSQTNLPQIFFSPVTFFNAMQWFLNAQDISAANPRPDDPILGMWTVTAQALIATETTGEVLPCYQRYRTEEGHYSYFGWSPQVHRAVPYPAPCVQQFEIHEVAQRKPGGNPNDNDAFRWVFITGGSSTHVKGGGYSATLDDLEVTEGGLIFVSLPDLPPGVPYPPPLVGRVVDYGPQGDPGPPGPPGPQGPQGDGVSDESFVATACGLSDELKNEFKECLELPDAVTWLSLATDATPVEVEAAQQVLIEKAPEVMLNTGEVVLIEDGAATMEATAIGAGRIHWILTLPIALLLGIKMIMQEVKVLDCDGSEGKGYRVINTPVFSFGDYNQAILFQELFRQIAWLLRCCPPCELNTWELYTQAQGNFASVSEFAFDAIMLKFVDPDGPEINAWYGDSSIHKYGEVRFILTNHIEHEIPGEKRRMTTLEFWNSREQVFECKRGTIVGFQISQEWAKPYEIWIRRRGQFDGPFTL